MKLRSSVVLNRLLAKVRVRHLQALVKLADLGNVNRTALAMGMTQPAVTLLLADLERLIETPLFLRHARGVTPTDMARDLLPLARHMLGMLEDSAELVASRLDQNEGLIRIAATPAGVSGVLANVLPAFSRKHPQIQVQVQEFDTPGIAASVASGTTDIAFCRQPAVLPQHWQFMACAQDQFVIVCGIQHPLARKPDLQLEDLKDATWLPNVASTAARDWYEALLQAQQWAPRTFPVITRSPSLAWALLDTEPLITLIPYSVVRPWVERTQLCVLPLKLAMPFDPLGMLVPQATPSAACEKLTEFVLGFQDHGPLPPPARAR